MHRIMVNYVVNSSRGHLWSIEFCLTHSNCFFFVSSFHLQHMYTNYHKKATKFYLKNAPQTLNNDIISFMVCHLWSFELIFPPFFTLVYSSTNVCLIFKFEIFGFQFLYSKFFLKKKLIAFIL